jgi:hypothetical protein
MSTEASAAEELAEQGTQVTAGESCGVQAEYREDVQERLGAGVSQAQPGDAGSVVADEGSQVACRTSAPGWDRG